MIHRAPDWAVEVVGRCLIVAGPDKGDVRYTGWSEVWMHKDGKLRVAWPKSYAKELSPIWIKVLRQSTIWYSSSGDAAGKRMVGPQRLRAEACRRRPARPQHQGEAPTP